MGYTHIQVQPIAGALGAEVTGVDLSRRQGDEVLAELRRVLLEHLVLFFPDQRIPPEALKAFGERFGSLNVHPFLPTLPGHPEIIVIDKKEDRTTNIGNGWHSDMSFLEQPPLGSILHCHLAPPYGGDTLFANVYLAYETLSTGMQRLLDGLSAIHDYALIFREAARLGRTRVSPAELEAARDAYPPVAHPVVRTHPETGRKLLYVNRFFTAHFQDMTPEESRPLLEFLFDHAAKPEFTCRYRWTPDAIAFWDNRCTQHYALNDYHGFRRLMYRVTVDGDRPF